MKPFDICQQSFRIHHQVPKAKLGETLQALSPGKRHGWQNIWRLDSQTSEDGIRLIGQICPAFWATENWDLPSMSLYGPL